jgi:hypothetical protein
MISKGNVTITREKSKVFDVWGKKVTLKKPLEFSMLKIDGQTVMSETPQEVGAMKSDAQKASGRALVAGLGLGVILKYIRGKCDVIDVVEPHQDVIDAYKEYRGGKVQYDNLYKTTIEDFLLAPPTEPKYDFVYLDTWYGLDSEYLPHINWMTMKAGKFLMKDGRVVSWGYDWMIKRHVDDCLELIGKGKRTMLLEADQRNIERLKLAMPLIGEFADWYRKNPDASKAVCTTLALDLSRTARESPVPLNHFKSWCLTREASEDAKKLQEMIDSKDVEGLKVMIGGQTWRPA